MSAPTDEEVITTATDKGVVVITEKDELIAVIRDEMVAARTTGDVGRADDDGEGDVVKL